MLVLRVSVSQSTHKSSYKTSKCKYTTRITILVGPGWRIVILDAHVIFLLSITSSRGIRNCGRTTTLAHKRSGSISIVLSRKYGLRKYMKLKHTVVKAEWDNVAAKWNLTVRKEDGSTFVDVCDYFLNGSGVLNNWKMPDIKGLNTFKGVLAHSAAWDKNIELDGKRVAVIGAGSSGVQLVANIQARVEHLYTWIRSPIWITVGFAQRFAGKNGANYAYSKETKELFDTEPIEYLKYRKLIEKEASNSFKVLLRGTDEALAAKEVIRLVKFVLAEL